MRILSVVAARASVVAVLGIGIALGPATGMALAITPDEQIPNSEIRNANSFVTEQSSNLQYLMLQSQMQHETRSYAAVSNIMKVKHDTVASTVPNLR